MSSGDVIREVNYVPSAVCGNDFQYYSRKTWSGADRLPGEDPGDPHNYNLQVVYLDRGLCKRKAGVTWYPGLVQSCVGGPSLIAGSWTASDENELLAKLAEKIRGHGFHGGNFAGTAGQTAGLIGDRAAALARGIRALKKGLNPKAIVAALAGDNSADEGYRKPKPRKRRGNLDLVADMSDRWLEAAYGWLPLLSDAYDGAEALAHMHESSSNMRFVAKHRITKSFDSVPNPYLIPVYSSRWEQSVRLQANLHREVNPLDNLNLTNPLEIAWELMPWSFAIDWFLPIGTWMNNAALYPKLRGVFIRTTRTRWRGESWSNRPDIVLVDKRCVHKTFTLSREISYGIQVPFPTLESPFSGLKRAANQIALLGQMGRRS